MFHSSTATVPPGVSIQTMRTFQIPQSHWDIAQLDFSKTIAGFAGEPSFESSLERGCQQAIRFSANATNENQEFQVYIPSLAAIPDKTAVGDMWMDPSVGTCCVRALHSLTALQILDQWQTWISAIPLLRKGKSIQEIAEKLPWVSMDRLGKPKAEMSVISAYRPAEPSQDPKSLIERQIANIHRAVEMLEIPEHTEWIRKNIAHAIWLAIDPTSPFSSTTRKSKSSKKQSPSKKQPNSTASKTPRINPGSTAASAAASNPRDETQRPFDDLKRAIDS